MVRRCEVSDCTLREGRRSLIWMLSRVNRAPLVGAEPMMVKASGLMGCRLRVACSRMEEAGLSASALPVLALTPRCSAIRFAKLHVVMPTYVAEQRHL